MKWVLSSLACLAAAAPAEGAVSQEPQEQDVAGGVDLLRVGHWVQVKGVYQGSGDFQAEKVELLQPESSGTLVGKVQRPLPNRERFWVNGQVVRTSEKTDWGELSFDGLEGRLVKVEGRYHGPYNFSARELTPRQKGRSSLEGRIDYLQRTNDGLEALIFNVRVLLPFDTDLELEGPIDSFALSQAKHNVATPNRRFVLEGDEAIPGTVKLTDTLRFGALFEVEAGYEDNYNLDETDPEDRRDYKGSVVGELRWEPRPDFLALLRGRGSYRHRNDQDERDESLEDLRLSEAWVLWSDILDSGAELQVGRQDFDDPREWLYDQNLDAVRAAWSSSWLRLELSASTTLTGGKERDRDSDNYIAYLSNNDLDQHLAAYVIDRRDDRQPRDYPIHFGLRALGEWLPDNDSWLEYSVLRGYAEDRSLESWALDVGTTWSPDFLEPFYLTVGYAYATGDDPSTPDVDESFRQTGLQDNNGKLGGVTSYRYYGELVDPELSNLGIATVGLGVRFNRDMSLDLVYHDYHLTEPATKLRDAELDAPMDGIHRGVGSEIDLVLGLRHWNGLDVKLTAGYFDPGSALPDADPAFLAGLRVRYRF